MGAGVSVPQENQSNITDSQICVLTKVMSQQQRNAKFMITTHIYLASKVIAQTDSWQDSAMPGIFH